MVTQSVRISALETLRLPKMKLRSRAMNTAAQTALYVVVCTPENAAACLPGGTFPPFFVLRCEGLNWRLASLYL